MTLMIGAGAIDENPIFFLFYDEENSAMRPGLFATSRTRRNAA
jgi:hypothetical protein